MSRHLALADGQGLERKGRAQGLIGWYMAPSGSIRGGGGARGGEEQLAKDQAVESSVLGIRGNQEPPLWS